MKYRIGEEKKLVLISLSLFILSNIAVIAYNFWYSTAFLGLGYDMIDESKPAVLRMFLIIGFSIEAYRRVNWARWGVIVLAALSVLVNLPGLSLLLAPSYGGLICLLEVLFNAIVIYLLLVPAGVKNYYKCKQE
jgi:hypothetical protein